jgi:PAS domain S-box-containing protein
MSSESKTKAELIKELAVLEKRLEKLEANRSRHSFTHTTKKALTAQQQKEIAQAESVQHYRMLSEASFEGIALTEQDVIVDCNDQLCKLLGYDRSELIGKSVMIGVSPASQDLVMNAIRSGREEPYEYVAVRKDGTQLPVEVQGRLVRIDTRDFRLTAMRDITKQKQTEEILHHERNLLRVLIDHLPDLFYFKDAQGRYMLNNPAHLRSIGAKRQEEVLGKTVFDFHPTHLAEQYFADEMKLVQTGESMIGKEELCFRHDTGKMHWHLTNKIPLKDFDGKVSGYVCISYDITEQKRVEEELRQERNLFRTLIDNLPDAVYVKDKTYRKTIANTADFRNIGKQTEEEVLGKTDHDVYPPEIADKFLEDDKSVIQMGQPIINREEYLYDAEGKIHWLLTSKLPLRGEEGNISGLVGVGREITEQKKIQDSLQQERNLLRTLIDSIPDLINYKDTEGRYLLNNRAHLRSIDANSQEDVLGKTSFDFHPTDLANQYRKQEMQVIRTGEPILNQEEIVCHRYTGAQRWYLTNRIPIKDHQGKVTSYLIISTDITERKRSQEELQNERNLLRTLIDNLTDYIYLKDAKGRFILGNSAVAHQLGFASEDELLGKTDFDLLPNELATQYYKSEQEIIRSGRGIYNNEGPAIDVSKEEKERWVSMTKIPLRDAQGTVIGTMGIGRDLTERKRMEETLRETADKFRFVFENAYDGLSVFEEASDRTQRRLVDCNGRYAEMAGRTREELLQLGVTKHIAKTINEDSHHSLNQGVVFSGSFSWLRPDGKDNVIEYTAVPIKIQNKIITIGIDRDVTERKRTEAEREQLITDLQNALAEIKTLSGLVPICATCKKIRDDKGYWTQVEAYIQARSQARFSHGICPDCMAKLYPQFMEK